MRSRWKTREKALATSTHTAAEELRPFFTGRLVPWLSTVMPPFPTIGKFETMWWAVPATWHQNPPALASSRSDARSLRSKDRVRRSPVSIVDVIVKTERDASFGVTVAHSPSFVPATMQYPFSMPSFWERKPPAQSLCSPRRHRRPQTNSSSAPSADAVEPIEAPIEMKPRENIGKTKHHPMDALKSILVHHTLDASTVSRLDQ